jgi:hypothetical protein
MTCLLLLSIFPRTRVVVPPLLLLHIDLLARPGLICCPFFSSGLNASSTRLRRWTDQQKRFEAACPNEDAREGSKSGAEKSGEHPQGFAERHGKAR